MKTSIVALLGNFLKSNPVWAKWGQIVLVVLFVAGWFIEGLEVPSWVSFLEHKATQIVEVLGVILLQYPNEKPDYKD